VIVLLLVLGILIGLTLGALGAGGSILAVPLLVHVAGLSAPTATATSLVAVGSAAALAASGHAAGTGGPSVLVGADSQGHDHHVSCRTTGLFWMLAVPLVVVAGCRASDSPRAIQGSGHIVIEQRPLADFQRVDLAGEGRLVMGPEEPASLEVRTDDNLMPLIESEVVDGTLIIGSRPHTDLAPSDGVTYRIACEEVSELRLSGSGEIEVAACPASDLTVRLDGSGAVQVDDVDATRVDAEIGGSGTISAIGQSSQVRASIAGSGMFAGADLQAREVEATIPGSGQITVWATGALHVDISGSGSVLYRGQPDITQVISGSGAVTPASGG
jgi:hypothetical protein